MPKKKAGKKKAVSPARAPHRGRRPKAVPIGPDVFCDILPQKKPGKKAPKRARRPAPAATGRASAAVGTCHSPAPSPPPFAKALADAAKNARWNDRLAWVQFCLYFAGVAACACDCPAAGLRFLLAGVLASFLRRG